MKPPIPAQSAKFFLMPSAVYFSKSPVWVETILGSCVAVTLHNRKHRVGAICHALLPKYRPVSWVDGRNQTFKFLDSSLNYLFRKFEILGIRPLELEAKVFGGGQSLFADDGSDNDKQIGFKNIHAAFLVLEQRGIPVLARDVGGATGRRVYFHTGSGDVYLRRTRDAKKNQGSHRR